MKRRTSRSRFLSLDHAVELLRNPAYRLVLQHSRTGSAFYVEPNGGPVSAKDATEIIKRPDAHILDRGLLPDCAQSWALGNPNNLSRVSRRGMG
jgi:hypothetical protein